MKACEQEKCGENQGCPIHCMWSELNSEEVVGIGFELSDCHLIPDLFPLIRAMIMGKWKCGCCSFLLPTLGKGSICTAGLAEFNTVNPPHACICWRPKEGGEVE